MKDKATPIFQAYIVFLLLLLQRNACLKLFSMVNEKEIKYNQQLTNLTSLPLGYKISFEFKPTAYLKDWANIIHLTTGGSIGVYGYRTPGVWLSPENNLYFASAINGTADSIVRSSITPPINKWIPVKISQINFANRYIFAIDVANSNIYSTQNTLTKNFSNVKVYLGNPWDSPQPGYVRSLEIVEMFSERSMHFKPIINVNISGQLIKNFLFLNTSINYSNETGAIAYNLTWEYMLPYFAKISSQSVNYLLNGSTYAIPDAFVINDITQYMNITLDMKSCSQRGNFTLEIPLKILFNDSMGNTIKQYSSFKAVVTLSYSLNPIIERDRDALKESYSRGVCWDQVESWIYACMNLYVKIRQHATFQTTMAKNGLDVRVGSVLGHHTLTRDLYVIHRNQKTYLMFNKVYEKWLAISNNEFEKNVSKFLNFSACLKLEGTSEEILTSQAQQWMGNDEGLFFRKSTNETWTRRIEWRILP
ncbi:uncharacterized protein LOC136091349 isoform X2 [Hydra vulgaris]|uniref:Uncharacterized protein LOC136091349 isoform X2 n=1 Tax=Hydra vulgaris TaxID=6087 RepID=A0ABM4DK23_HYDVU